VQKLSKRGKLPIKRCPRCSRDYTPTRKNNVLCRREDCYGPRQVRDMIDYIRLVGIKIDTKDPNSIVGKHIIDTCLGFIDC